MALLAEAYASLGDPVTSDRFRREAEAATTNRTSFFRSDVARASAWTWAASGEVSHARASLLATAERCRDAAEPGIEIHVLHDALRFGARQEVAGRLRELVEIVDGAWPRPFADHARALVADDGPALDDVAATFEEIGALRHAAEARAEAAVAHQRAGLVARASLEGGRRAAARGVRSLRHPRAAVLRRDSACPEPP